MTFPIHVSLRKYAFGEARIPSMGREVYPKEAKVSLAPDPRDDPRPPRLVMNSFGTFPRRIPGMRPWSSVLDAVPSPD